MTAPAQQKSHTATTKIPGHLEALALLCSGNGTGLCQAALGANSSKEMGSQTLLSKAPTGRRWQENQGLSGHHVLASWRPHGKVA